MAIDSQPSEPFQARNGAVVMAPGGRVDAFVDVTAAAGTAIPILLHDGKEARTSANSLSPANRRSVRPRFQRPRRCPPTASPSGWS